MKLLDVLLKSSIITWVDGGLTADRRFSLDFIDNMGGSQAYEIMVGFLCDLYTTNGLKLHSVWCYSNTFLSSTTFISYTYVYCQCAQGTPV